MPRIYGDSATDAVMQMQTAPLTPQQVQYIQQYEQRPAAATVNRAASSGSVISSPDAGRTQYDAQYPKGKGQYPIYPDPGGLYTPGGPQNEPYPGATADRRAEATLGGQAKPRYYAPGGYDASVEAKRDRTGPGFDLDMPEFFSPDQAWDWRAKIRGGAEPSTMGGKPIYTQGNTPADTDMFIPQNPSGRPGQRIVHEYGSGYNSGYGSTRVMATADKTGRFNQYGDVPGAPTGPGSGAGGYRAPADPYGINAEIAATRQRLAGYRAGGSLADRILAGGARRHLGKLQQLGIANAQQQLTEDRYRPEIAIANARNDQLQRHGLSGLQAFTAAAGGHHNLLVLPEILGNRVMRPYDVPEGGAVYKSGNNTAQPVLPTIQPLPYQRGGVTSPYTLSDPNDIYLR